jgi:hypothetical protein
MGGIPDWIVVLMATVAAIPVVVVLGSATLLTIGGPIGCVRSAFTALACAVRLGPNEGQRQPMGGSAH